MPIHFLELRFSPVLEQEFLDDYFEKSLKTLRIAIVFGALLYALFGLLDAWLIPEVKMRAWLVRYAAICPFCLLVLPATYVASFKKYMQPLLAFLIFFSGRPDRHHGYRSQGEQLLLLQRPDPRDHVCLHLS